MRDQNDLNATIGGGSSSTAAAAAAALGDLLTARFPQQLRALLAYHLVPDKGVSLTALRSTPVMDTAWQGRNLFGAHSSGRPIVSGEGTKASVVRSIKVLKTAASGHVAAA